MQPGIQPTRTNLLARLAQMRETGVVFGVLNGVFVTYVRILAMIVTLGMMNMARGLALIISGGRVVNLSPRTVKDPGLQSFIFLGQGKIDAVPVMCVVFAIVGLLSALAGQLNIAFSAASASPTSRWWKSPAPSASTPTSSSWTSRPPPSPTTSRSGCSTISAS